MDDVVMFDFLTEKSGLEKKFQKNDSRGMVGIGTLIVFIAMIIVAAVAAGVLLRTSGKLQQQATTTGQETIRQVSSGVKLRSILGNTDSNSKIENIVMVATLRAGSQGINLRNTVIQYASDNEAVHLRMGGSSFDNRSSITLKENTFYVNKIQNTSGSENYMLADGSDVAQIWISPGSIEDGSGLPPSTEISITLMPANGFQSYAEAMVPPILGKNRSYEL